jgi:hypothetical protein
MEEGANTSAVSTKTKLTYVPAKAFSLKAHPAFDERWLEKLISEHPEILGLEGTEVVRAQILQKSGGKLDLLLRDQEDEKLYTVELMLGELDASHLVRTLDYFLREQTRPGTGEWTHVAVLVAEDILHSRFLGVTEYLSKIMPLIVIELSALQVGEDFTLKSTRIFDGAAEREGKIEQHEEYTREDWIKKSSAASIELVDRFLPILGQLANDLRLTYKKVFIGIAIGNRAENFVYFDPKRDFVRVSVRISDTADWKQRMAEAGFGGVGVEETDRVRFRVSPEQFQAHRDLFVELFSRSYREWTE